MPPSPKNPSLALDSQDDVQATFVATYAGKSHDNPFDLWAALWGYDADGVNRSQSYVAIRWNETKPVAGATCQVVLPKNIDPAHPNLTYRAYIWRFPSSGDPVSNVVEF